MQRVRQRRGKLTKAKPDLAKEKARAHFQTMGQGGKSWRMWVKYGKIISSTIPNFTIIGCYKPFPNEWFILVLTTLS